MRTNVNSEKIEGYLYQLGDSNGRDVLSKKVSGKNAKVPGTEFYSGTIEVAVDEEGFNIIPVHFTYVTETFSSGKENRNFGVLAKIVENPKTWLSDGKEGALKVKIDATLGVNDFYAADGNLVSTKRNEGSFISIVNNLSPEEERNKFIEDIVITSVTHVDKDEEKNIKEESTVVRGVVFDFKNAILPVDFVVKNAQGMKYFEGLDVDGSNPFYTKVWGRINCSTITYEIKEESAFGEAAVSTRTRRTREWIITGTSPEGYEFGEEKVLTVEELTKAMQDRQVYLADVKRRAEEYAASKKAPTAEAPAKTAQPSTGMKKQAFNF